MSRYIETEPIIEELKNQEKFSLELLEEYLAEEETSALRVIKNVLSLVYNAPTADVVEVVRCKDCKYCGAGQYGISTLCDKTIAVVDKDHFCSYGETYLEKAKKEENK